MTEINVTTYRQLLEAQARELQELNEATQSDTAPVELDQAAVGRLSRMDALQQQAMAEETRRRRLREIALIEAALDRIEEGEYGFCLTCGEAIPETRLHLDPAAAFCVAHARL
ncbi:MAG: TraR/DksA family transcriptional regulator [Parvibaculales bacterium]